MRATIICVGLTLLSGCKTSDGTPIITDGTLTGAIKEYSNPGSTYKARQAADDAKCRELGFKPGTEGYGNCRLKLEEIRTIRNAAAAARAERSAQSSQ